MKAHSRFVVAIIVTVASTCVSWHTFAQDNDDGKGQALTRPNIKLKTLGGKQLWSDVFWLQEWRIQQHALSKHFRLLDPKNARHAWGTLQQCRDIFEQRRKALEIPKPRSRVVIVLHGLGRSKSAMQRLATELANDETWSVANLSYASGRLSIHEHALNLEQILTHLHQQGVTEVNFVAHSLGNLVVRRYLGLQQAKSTKHADDLPEVKRIVMLGPPNQGSRLAEILQKNPIFRLLAGETGQQIAQLPQLATEFPTPTCEFAIIAGGRGADVGRNPILDGDDDLIVSVEETKLAGARDFLVVPVLHTFIMNDPSVQKATRRFLADGFLVSAEKRVPLENGE